MRLTQVLLLATIASCLLAAKTGAKNAKTHKDWVESETPEALKRTQVDLKGLDVSSIQAIAEALLSREPSQADFDAQKLSFGKYLETIEPVSLVKGYHFVVQPGTPVPVGRADQSVQFAKALMNQAVGKNVNITDLYNLAQKIAFCDESFAFQAFPPSYRDYLEVDKIFVEAHYILVFCAEYQHTQALWIGGSVNGVLRPEFEGQFDPAVEGFVGQWLRRSIFNTILKRCPVA